MDHYSFDEEAPPTIVKRTSTRSNNPYVPGRASLNQSGTSLGSSMNASPVGSFVAPQSHPEAYYHHPPQSHPEAYYRPQSHSENHYRPRSRPQSHSQSYHSHPHSPSFPHSHPDAIHPATPNYCSPYGYPQSPVYRAPLLLRPTSNYVPDTTHHHPSTYPGVSGTRSPSSSSSCDSFVMGSGGQPRPFKSRPTGERPLKAKWERRRNQVKKQLLNTLNIPDQQRLIDTIPACQEMVDTIRDEVYTTLHAINNQYELAKGKTPTDTDRLPTLPLPASKDPQIHPPAPPNQASVPKPPPGHKSFRKAIQQRHRSLVSVMFVGLDSAKPTSQLELIILVTHDLVYVISMAAVGAAAFTDGGLASFFEDPLITKLSFDCRPDAEILYTSFGVRLQGLCDLQVLATMALSPAGQYMISRRTMFQRISLDHFSDTDIPCFGGAQLSLRDARYLIVAYFMFDFFEEEGRQIGAERIRKVISGDYTKCHIRDF